MQKKMLTIAAAFMCLGYTWGSRIQKRKKYLQKSDMQKRLTIYKMWLEKVHKGESVADFISQKNYKRVAVYGLGKLGVSLINELKGRGINIAYIIDQRAEEIFYKDIDVYPFSDRLPHVDVVVITTVNDENVLKEKIMSHMKCDVYLLEELVMAC